MDIKKLFMRLVWGEPKPEPRLEPKLQSLPKPKIAPLVEKIRAMAKKPEDVMHYKRYQVTAEEVSAWLNLFADGVQYVYEKYGHSPKDFQIHDRIEHSNKHQKSKRSLLFDGGQNSIMVTRGYISDSIRKIRDPDTTYSSWNTGDRNDFTYQELTILEGVEEAYHSYQYNCLPDAYRHKDWTRSTSTAFEYANCPIERDAGIIVLLAAKRLRLGANSDVYANDNCAPSSTADKMTLAR